MQRETEPVVLRSGARKWLGLFGVCGAFAVVGGLMVADGRSVGLVPLVSFGFGALVALACLVARPELRFDAQGFTTTHLWRSRRYELDQCSEFSTWTWEQPMGAKTSVVVFDYPSTRRAGWLARANARMAGRSEALPDTFGLSADALADMLNDRRGTPLER